MKPPANISTVSRSVPFAQETVHKYYFQRTNPGNVDQGSMLDGSTERWTDVFFDTDDYALLQRGIWLRCRGDERWSWKDTKYDDNNVGELTYFEETNVDSILVKVKEILGKVGDSSTDPSHLCSNVIAMFTTSRITYHVGPSKLYLDCTELAAGQFYVVGGYVPAPNIPNEEIQPVLEALINEYPRRASSKIVEYYRCRKERLPDERIWGLLLKQLPSLQSVEGPEYYSTNILHKEPDPPTFHLWYDRIEYLYYN